jgi:competence protein ComEC
MVYYLNVGQGDAEMIRVNEDKELLIDAGPDMTINSALGENLSLFDNEIEAVMISHMHADHIAGLNYILDRRKVGKIYLYDESYKSPDAELLVQKIIEKNIPIEKVSQDKEVDFYGVRLKFLWPEESYSSENPNDSSVAMEASYGACKYLFLGDLTAKNQETLVDTLSEIDVIKISHHGSKDGTSDAVIAKTKPEYSVIPVGANKFGHPAPSTLSKLTSTKVLRTDQIGTIKFGCNGQNTLLLP